MNFEYLPIGSVVLLKESTRRVMVVGLCQRGAQTQKVYDYVGVVFPEGFVSADKMFLFNNEQIDVIFSLGYMDEEQLRFLDYAEEKFAELKQSANHE